MPQTNKTSDPIDKTPMTSQKHKQCIYTSIFSEHFDGGQEVEYFNVSK